MDFHGVKIALQVDGKLLMQLRDDKPGLFMANMWDFPGGGREGNETATECAIRETQEEFEITLHPQNIVWSKFYPAMQDPNSHAVFMVGHITSEDIESITLHEGQKWELFDEDRFLSDEQVVPHLKTRYLDYMNRKVLKFRPHLCEQIQSGEKTATWRLFDDKDLQAGDDIDFVNWESRESFGSGTITALKTKTLGTLEEADWEGHERFESEEEMYATYRSYYGDKVSPDTEVKIIDFSFTAHI